MNRLTSVFFAPENYTGVKLSATSANHIANIAKEKLNEIESKLEEISCVETKLSIIGSTEENTISYGITKKDLEEIPNLISKNTKYKSLIAWLREAIKAKDKISSELNILNTEDYCKVIGVEYPEAAYVSSPLTESKYYDSLSIKERNRYFMLETEAAVLGNCIHQKGSLNTARRKLASNIKNPKEVVANGRDTLIYTKTPTVSIEDIDQVFFALQKKHREVQSELNSIKAKCQKAISEDQIRYSDEWDEANRVFNNKIKELDNKRKKYVTEMLQKVNDLKIIIPDALLDIYKEVTKD